MCMCRCISFTSDIVQRLLCCAVYMDPSSSAARTGSVLHQLSVRKQVWKIAAPEIKRLNGTKRGLFHCFVILMASLIEIKIFSN